MRLLGKSNAIYGISEAAITFGSASKMHIEGVHHAVLNAAGHPYFSFDQREMGCKRNDILYYRKANGAAEPSPERAHEPIRSYVF